MDRVKPKYYCISFSGGKDSTALTLEYLKRRLVYGTEEYPLDEVLYCDTWKEFPQMVKHIEKIEKLVVLAGVKFTRVKSEKSFDYYLLEHKFKQRTKKQMYKDREIKGYGWAGSRSRWCTSKLKQDVIAKYFKPLEVEYEVVHLIGIAADEQYRLERPGNQSSSHKHPLVEWGWTEKQCLEYCYRAGFTWDGLYTIFDRVSCWCCPLQSLDDLRKLRKHFPDLWADLRELDSKTWRVFSGYRTVEDLEVRFSLEDKYIADGRPIRSKAFYAEYNTICPPGHKSDWCNKKKLCKNGRSNTMNERTQNLLKLIQENPDLPIVPMVDGEICWDDSGYWLGSFGVSSVDAYLVDKYDHVRFKSDDEVCEVLENMLSDEEFEALPDYEEECRPAYEALPWIKAIVVYIGLPD